MVSTQHFINEAPYLITAVRDGPGCSLCLLKNENVTTFKHHVSIFLCMYLCVYVCMCVCVGVRSFCSLSMSFLMIPEQCSRTQGKCAYVCVRKKRDECVR